MKLLFPQVMMKGQTNLRTTFQLLQVLKDTGDFGGATAKLDQGKGSYNASVVSLNLGEVSSIALAFLSISLLGPLT